MPVVEESIAIDRPVADVFEFIPDGNNVARYKASVAARNRSASVSWARDSLARSQQGAWQVVRLGDGSLGGRRYPPRLQAHQGGRLGGVFGKIAEPLVVKAQTRTFKANLANLKELPETHAD
jgi:hypothetical protein